MIQRSYCLQKQVQAITRQQKLLELETDNLPYEQRYYKGDEYKELAVRERLGLVLPGEKALILPPNSEVAKQADISITNHLAATTVSPNSYQQWVNFIFFANYQRSQVSPTSYK